MQESSCGQVFLLGEREHKKEERGEGRQASGDRSSRREERKEGETDRQRKREVGGRQGPFKRECSEYAHRRCS